MGAKSEKEEYWVLGAQFLQNYYSMYDFKEHKIGLIESVTSRMITQKPSATQTSTAPKGALESNIAAAGEAAVEVVDAGKISVEGDSLVQKKAKDEKRAFTYTFADKQ